MVLIILVLSLTGNSGGKLHFCIHNKLPQGFILGPLLFVYYINDLSINCNHTSPFIYEDETALLAHGSNELEMKMKLKTDLDNINN